MNEYFTKSNSRDILQFRFLSMTKTLQADSASALQGHPMIGRMKVEVESLKKKEIFEKSIDCSLAGSAHTLYYTREGRDRLDKLIFRERRGANS
jgi:hypothetical protein